MGVISRPDPLAEIRCGIALGSASICLQGGLKVQTGHLPYTFERKFTKLLLSSLI